MHFEIECGVFYLTKQTAVFYYVSMFYRFLCLFLLLLAGLNVFLYLPKITTDALDLQKPYISEVYKNNAVLPQQCYEGKLISTYPRGLCHIDIWIEISNPTSSVINLKGYKLNFVENYRKSANGNCVAESGVYCKPISLDGYSIEPKSQIVFKEEFGKHLGEGFISSLGDSTPNSYKKFLIHPNMINESNIYFSFEDDSRAILETQSLQPMATSAQFCLTVTGDKVQSLNKPSTPGLPNDCPKAEKNSPIIPAVLLQTPKLTKEPEKIKEPAELTQITTESQKEIIKDKALQDVDSLPKQENKAEKPVPNPTANLPTVKVPNPPQQAQIAPLTIPKIEIKTEVKNKAESKQKKIEPVIFKVEQETIPVQNKIENNKINDKAEFKAEKSKEQIMPLQLETKNAAPIQIFQKPAVIKTQEITKLAVQSTPAMSQPKIEGLNTSLNKSLTNQTKTVKILDENQEKIFGVASLKSFTVDMHTVKANFIYFDVAILLFLLSKTTLENKGYVKKIMALLYAQIYKIN